jgi:hypothetical protein
LADERIVLKEYISNGVPNLQPRLDLDRILTDLFQRAKEADEFEFICTVLRIKGAQNVGWDTFIESSHLIDQLTRQINSPIEDSFRVRLMLFLYSHVCELDDMYDCIANLISICGGNRYRISMLDYDSPTPKTWADHSNSMKPAYRVARLARAAGFAELADLMDTAFLRPVRNAFVHSSYTIYQNDFRIRQRSTKDVIWIESENPDGVRTRTPVVDVPFEWLVPFIEVAVDTAMFVINKLEHERQTYTRPKKIRGRMGENGDYTDIMLIADSNGLRGFSL